MFYVVICYSGDGMLGTVRVLCEGAQNCLRIGLLKLKDVPKVV